MDFIGRMFRGGEPSSSSVVINGMEFKVIGSQVFINGRLYVPADGDSVPTGVPDLTPKQLVLDRDGRIVGDVHGDVRVIVQGGQANLTIEGSVKGSVSTEGDVTVKGNVGGSASAQGDITTSNVGGSANAGGDITASRIGGSANAGRSIYR